MLGRRLQINAYVSHHLVRHSTQPRPSLRVLFYARFWNGGG
jgi:hypothetical protein